MLRKADFVIVCAALNETTQGMIGPAELALMKPGATLVNTARGAIVDEQALYAALQAGRIAGACLDVFGTEPPDSRPRP